MPEVMKVPEGETLLTDEQLCKELDISYSTLYAHLRNGPPRKRHGRVPDVRDIRWTIRSGQRRWFKTSLVEFLHGN